MKYELLMNLAVKSDNHLFIMQAWNAVILTEDLNLIKSLNHKYRASIIQSVSIVTKEEHEQLEPVKPEDLIIDILNSLGQPSSVSENPNK